MYMKQQTSLNNQNIPQEQDGVRVGLLPSNIQTSSKAVII